jgi:hypothetical protein
MHGNGCGATTQGASAEFATDKIGNGPVGSELNFVPRPKPAFNLIDFPA